tara:strand:- start:50 stop:982 length:933 start_codon:yes stop_codon:yes gene_type:complete
MLKLNRNKKKIPFDIEGKLIYQKKYGSCWSGDSIKLMKSIPSSSIDLIFTSPPYALLTKKSYGNVSQSEYVDWFRPFANEFHRILKDSGSFVLNIGSSWIKGQPTKSIYQYELLVDLCRRKDMPEKSFYLAQEFFWHNPAKLPLPVEWVNRRRVRVKETIENIFWFSKTPNPKSDNNKTLIAYSPSQEKLFLNGYNKGKRPSGSIVGDKWNIRHKGAIPPNLLAFANTKGTSKFREILRKKGLKQHPAVFPEELPEFFINLCTDVNDIVFDPFSGSNTTGFISEKNKRRWLSFEKLYNFAKTSRYRFQDE